MVNMRLARLIDLVPYITKHQGISISELAKKFGATVAEIESDLWLLYCCGLPGQTPLELMEFQFEDGFVTVRNADELKAPRSLTQIEIASLIIGLEILATEGSEVAKDLKGRLAQKLSSQVSYQPTGTEKFIAEISKAIQKNQLLKIVYGGKERHVIPFEIYAENGGNYLRAYCKFARDRRTFNISRIDSLELLDIHELAPNEVPSDSKPLRTKIKVHRDARRVREVFGATEEIQYFSKDWLFQQVFAFGGAVELIDPSLRSELQALLHASQSLYFR